MKLVLLLTVAAVALSACTQETQNKIGRAINNWTGTNGVLEVYSSGKLVRRFVKIDKLSTASGTQSDVDRPYRFGYGHLDMNLNGVADDDENRVYFEISDYSTEYVFFEAPQNMGKQ